MVTHLMNLHTIVVGAFEVNCFILEPSEGSALVVDPGADHERIAELLIQNHLTPKAYLLTHGHMDHISALKDLHDLYPAPIALHGDDTKWAFTAENAMPPFYPPPLSPGKIDIDLKNCPLIPDLGVTCKVIHTPGHTPGSVCFHFPDDGILLTGDTLFAGSVGRTDLNGGSARVLSESLKKLKLIPDETTVLAGHGPSSTILEEKRTNYFMQQD